MKIKLTKSPFYLRKGLLINIMRTFIFLFCTTVFSFTPENVLSQNAKIKIDTDKTVTIDEVFDMITNQTEYAFMYQDDLFIDFPKVNLKKGVIRVNKLLKKSLAHGSFNYIVTHDNTILIKQKNKSQQKLVSGTVTDEAGLPLPGVTVQIKGTDTGAVSNIDGAYRIVVIDPASVLVFKYLGYESIEITVADQRVINISLKPIDEALKEVVLNYHGIKREKKALGFGVSKIDPEEIEELAEVDLAKAIQGKVSGVEIIQTSGATGAKTEIIIRSKLSITDESGGNNALIILDGIPYNGDFFEIDANDIKNIEILKGLSATILYGTDGRNGVLLIETLSGAPTIGGKKMKLSVSRTDYINLVGGLPEYQTKYGPGRDRTYRTNSRYSWGPAFANIDSVAHPYQSHAEIFPEFENAKIPYKVVPDHIKKFFHTGLGKVTSLKLASSQETTAFNLALGHAKESGVLGENELERFNVGAAGVVKINDKLELNLNLNFSQTKTFGQSAQSIFSRLYTLPNNIDFTTLPYQDPQTGASVFSLNSITNPLWIINNTKSRNDRLRASGTFNAKYKINEHLALNYLAGVTINTGDGFNYSNRGGVKRSPEEFGYLDIDYSKRSTIDQKISIFADYELSDKIGFSTLLGIHSKIDQSKSGETSFRDQITFDYIRPTNFNIQDGGDYFSSKRNNFGIYGQMIVDYNDYVFLTASARNDWASTLEPDYRRIFYPSISFSFLPIKAFNIDSNIFNYIKLRGSVAESVGFPSPYKTRATYGLDPRALVYDDNDILTTTSPSSTFPNPALKPELHREYEIGLEARFFNNRLDIETSIYHRKSFGQLTNIRIDPANGYTGGLVNLGRVDTKGIELDLEIDVIRGVDFGWKIRNTFTAYKTEVVELEQDEIFLGGRSFAIKGEPLGVQKGSYVLRDDEGNLLIYPNFGGVIRSIFVNTPNDLPDKIIADPTPDFRLNSFHEFIYKNFTLYAQFEHLQGGKSYSAAVGDLIGRGVTRDTENREGSFIIRGVVGELFTGLPILDENGNTIPNTTQSTLGSNYRRNYFDGDDISVYDNTVFRIREIALRYRFGKKDLKKLPFKNLAFKLSARNVFYHAPDFPKYTNIDPAISSSNGITFPSTKRYALSISASF